MEKQSPIESIGRGINGDEIHYHYVHGCVVSSRNSMHLWVRARCLPPRTFGSPLQPGEGVMDARGSSACAGRSLCRLARVHLLVSLTSLCCGFQFRNVEKRADTYWFRLWRLELKAQLKVDAGTICAVSFCSSLFRWFNLEN